MPNIAEQLRLENGQAALSPRQLNLLAQLAKYPNGLPVSGFNRMTVRTLEKFGLVCSVGPGEDVVGATVLRLTDRGAEIAKSGRPANKPKEAELRDAVGPTIEEVSQ